MSYPQNNMGGGVYRGAGRGGNGYHNNNNQMHMMLPPGWQAAFTASGEPYYIDHNTRTTYWEIPAEVVQNFERSRGFRGRGRRGIDRNKVKTKMCMNIENGGKCSWGENCAFAHSSEELSTQPHFNSRPGNNGQDYNSAPGQSTNNNNNHEEAVNHSK